MNYPNRLLGESLYCVSREGLFSLSPEQFYCVFYNKYKPITQGKLPHTFRYRPCQVVLAFWRRRTRRRQYQLCWVVLV